MKLKIIFVALAFVLLAAPMFAQTTTSGGAWTVTYTIGDTTRTFTFIAANNGTGTFRFRFPSAAIRSVFPAVWQNSTPNRISFTSEVQFPLSNTLRENGTLVFKGFRGNDGRLQGPVIYIVDNVLAATPTPFTIRNGTFTAVPLTPTGGVSDLSRSR